MSTNGLSIIQRVIAVLDAFEVTDHSLTATEIARRTGIPVPSTHRIVRDLVETGALERLPDRSVRVGNRLWELANRSAPIAALREAALPHMEDLQAEVRHYYTQLAVLDGDDVLYVARLTAQTTVPNITVSAGRLLALTTSPGLVLAAYADPERREELLDAVGVRFTSSTVTDRTELEAILDRVRLDGYSVTEGWVHPQSTGISVPVLEPGGAAVAALSVIVPRAYPDVAALVPALRTTSRGITRSLTSGGRLPPHLARLQRQTQLATGRRRAGRGGGAAAAPTGADPAATDPSATDQTENDTREE